MPFRENPLWAWVPWVFLGAAALLQGVGAAAAEAPAVTTFGQAATVEEVPFPSAILDVLRPDYAKYIREVRPMKKGYATAAGARRLYMALVKPGAQDPASHASAPFAGPGVRNDIVYDQASLGDGRSEGWILLLLDHEYFHARHLAGATSLPLPRGLPGGVVSHFYEAAAWGFNVAEARSGRYPGLRMDEFTEALDRYGEHYRELRRVAQESGAATWNRVRAIFNRPTTLSPRIDRSPVAVRARPAAPDRDPAIP